MTTPPFPPGPPGRPPSEAGDPRTGPWPGRPADHLADHLADRLLERRIVSAGGRLDRGLAAGLSARLMLLGSAGEEPVTLHLGTPDGELDAAFTVADTIGLIACPVRALVVGRVGGPALLVLAAAGRREMTRNATLALAEPTTDAAGDATDLAAQEEENRRRVDAFYARLAAATGREVDEIRRDAEHGRLFTADEAVGYGLVQAVAGRS